MTAKTKATLSYVFMGIGAAVLAVSLLLLIATYQHNAAVADEVEAARAAASHAAEADNDEEEEQHVDREQALAEIDAQAAVARGSFTPAGLMLIAGAGSLFFGFRLYRQANAGEEPRAAP